MTGAVRLGMTAWQSSFNVLDQVFWVITKLTSPETYFVDRA